MAAAGLRPDTARHGRGPARGRAAGQCRPVRPARQCDGPCLGRRHRARKTPWLAEIEAVWGPAPGRAQSDGRGVFVLGAQFGKVFVGVQPRVRLRRRPDAPSVRAGLCPDPCLHHLLPLAARGFRGRCASALRDARRAGVHAGQAGGHGAGLLARPADRRAAQHLPLRRQQPVRGVAGQAPLERDHGHAPDAAAGAGRALQGPAGAEGQPETLARDRPGSAGTGRAGGADRRTGGGGGPGRARACNALDQAAGNRGCADPGRAACSGSAHQRRRDGGLPRHPRAGDDADKRAALREQPGTSRPRSRRCCAPLAATSSRPCRGAT